MATIKELRKKLEKHKATSAWDKGIKVYADLMLDNLVDNGASTWSGKVEDLHTADWGWAHQRNPRRHEMDDWREESYGGSWLIYNEDIAKTLTSPSKFKKTDNGAKRPNPREEWLDVQARALYQAAKLLQELNEEIKEEKASPKAIKLKQVKMTNAKLGKMSRSV